MTTFTEAPYNVAPFDAEPLQPDGGKLRLTRYFLATVLEGADGFSTLHPVTRHYATREMAESWLPERRLEYPNARLSLTVLEFDVENDAELTAYLRMQQEYHREPADLEILKGGLQ
jgi:hypothetical protein